jgi:outer membrane cobalamin receptor
MKFIILISLLVGAVAFAPMARPKTPSAAMSPFAAPNAVVVAPLVIHKASSTALRLNFNDDFGVILAGIVAFAGTVNSILGIVGFFNSLKNEIKADVDKGFQGIKTEFQELKADTSSKIDRIETGFQGLKTELKAEFQGLKTDTSSKIDRIATEFQGLKTELKAEFQGVKTDTSSQIDRVENSFSEKIKAQDKIIEANGIKIDGRFLVYEAWHKHHAKNGTNIVDDQLHDNEVEALNTTIDTQGEDTVPKN